MTRIVAPPPRQAVAPRATPPTFSVVIAAYQAEATIDECVASALAQTMPPLEVIVVDDGSTDGTARALTAYSDRIVYVRQENRGKAAAVNVAARRAEGEFVSILDADDVYEPTRLEALGELARLRPDLDILMTDAYLEVDGQLVGRFCERTPFATVDQSVAIFEDCFVAWPAIRRDRLLEVGGFDESPLVAPAEDWECWIRLLHAGSVAGLVDEPLLRYRIHGGSLTSDRLNTLRSRVHILEVAASLDLSPPQRAALQRFLRRRRNRLLLAQAEQALRTNAPDARRRSLAAARSAGMPLLARLRALAAALAPRTAARVLGTIEARTGSSRTRRPIPTRRGA
jgi:glycosyltransferase involved in cell wall biosynthesis